MFAKARDFFTSFDKVRGKQEKKASSGLFGVGGPVSFAVGYERMQTWYCKQPENASKSICAAKSKSAKGPHPLFNKSHPEHDDWVQMASGYCAHPDFKKQSGLLCVLVAGHKNKLAELTRAPRTSP